MFRNEQHSTYHDVYEYFGSTEIERIRRFDDQSIQHDWLIFDSVDEAMDYFNEWCGEDVWHAQIVRIENFLDLVNTAEDYY